MKVFQTHYSVMVYQLKVYKVPLWINRRFTRLIGRFIGSLGVRSQELPLASLVTLVRFCVLLESRGHEGTLILKGNLGGSLEDTLD